MGGAVKHSAPSQTTGLVDEGLVALQKKWNETAESVQNYCDLDVRGMWEVTRVAAKLSHYAKTSKEEAPDQDGWVAVPLDAAATAPVFARHQEIRVKEVSEETFYSTDLEEGGGDREEGEETEDGEMKPVTD
jgi:hypothetical protein